MWSPNSMTDEEETVPMSHYDEGMLPPDRKPRGQSPGLQEGDDRTKPDSLEMSPAAETKNRPMRFFNCCGTRLWRKPLSKQEVQSVQEFVDDVDVEEDAEPSFLERHLRLFRIEQFGNIREVHLGCFGKIYIGPHWPFSLGMLAIIVGVGGLHLRTAMSIANSLDPANSEKHVRDGGGTLSSWIFLDPTLTAIFTFLTGVFFVWTALSDPGLLRTHRSPLGRRCTICDLVQTRGCVHCETCGYCIEDFDHHCPWVSKCVGKGNLSKFHTFTTVGLLSLVYIVMATLLLISPNDNGGNVLQRL